MKQKIIFGLLFLILVSVTTVCNAQDLVLHLSFDELEGDVVKDLSEFGNDATFNKGNPKLIDGVFGQAMEFDGQTAAEIDDSPSLVLLMLSRSSSGRLSRAVRQSRAALRKDPLGSPVYIILPHSTTVGRSFNSLIFQNRATTTISVRAFKMANGTSSPRHGTVMTLNSTLMANSKQRCRVRVNYHRTMSPFISVHAAQASVSLPVLLMKSKSITTL